MMAATSVRDEPSMEEILASIRKIISEQDTENTAPQARGSQPAAAAPVAQPQKAASLAAVQDDVFELTTVLNDDGTITELASMGEDILADDFDSMVADAMEIAEEVPKAHSVAAALQDVAADLADFSEPAVECGVGEPEFADLYQDAEPLAAFPDLACDTMTTEAEPVSASADHARFASESAADHPQSPTSAHDTVAARPAAEGPTSAQLLSAQAMNRSLSALSELRVAMNISSQPSGTSVTLEDLTRELLRPMLKDWLDANLPPMVERIVRDEIRKMTAAGL
jgi:cell pole-organizing protein PopZ